ncbi:cytochrome P450 [Blastococcus sp. PRF04-17]|uniref:cytochrome P450 n=1 Tax=Blastococcus sp. PRF04-17 TaxID=2933797 RepID=UPI001FF2FC1F|nr:cytochrome P450 [Blastococcus sp. PRF04-17]UOY01767.1 cytochrome P450 [Blastococcus sp. PRF04-17]
MTTRDAAAWDASVRGQVTWIRSHAEALEILLSHDFGASLHEGRSRPVVGNSLLTLVGPAHNERRRSEIVMFSRRSLMEYEFGLVMPAVQESLDEAVASPDGEIDLLTVTHNALLRVSARIVGLDGVDSLDAVLRLKELAGPLGEGASVEWAADPDAVVRTALAAKQEFAARFWEPARRRRDDLVARYRAGELTEDELPEDLLTILLKKYDSWDDDDLLRECIFFLIASASTTTHSAPHTLLELTRWLEEHPEDVEKTTDLGFLQRAVSEALRVHPPVPALLRLALEDKVLSTGRRIAAGEALALDLNAANRDEDAFGADADRFDPHRTVGGRSHPYGLSFGSGPHTCPGRLVALGGGAVGKVDRDDVNIGVLTRIMAELFRRDVRLVPDRPPVKRTDTAADRFASFPVTVGVHQ